MPVLDVVLNLRSYANKGEVGRLVTMRWGDPPNWADIKVAAWAIHDSICNKTEIHDGNKVIVTR